MDARPVLRVVVADDHPPIRERLRFLLEAEADIAVVGVAKDGAEAMRVALDLDPDVVLVDNDMPVLSGLDVVRFLRQERPAMRVVLYTADADVCDDAIAAGAAACVAKGEPTDGLIATLRRAGLGGYAAGAPSRMADIDGRSAVSAADLRGAIADGALSVALQPLVELRTGRLSRLEALARWSHPSAGMVSPTRFIALAEANALITPLTLFVVERASRQLRDMRARRPTMRVNFNLSPLSLRDPDFEGALLGALARADCPPAAVSVEITETMLMHEPAAAARMLARFRELGMRVEVDDFGTGFSSLGQLIDLPLDAVKIDRRFVRTMTRDHKNEAIVRAIVALAHDLALETVAEGIEDRETFELLHAIGCDTAQGYYVGVPVAAAAIPAWIESWEHWIVTRTDERVRRASASDVGATEILVVDDEPPIVEVIRGVLEHEGFRVTTAANGAEALAELEHRLPALVLLDMQMPILDGQGLVREIRLREMNVPVVVMTAGSSAVRWARELSVDAYLSKPFEIDQLIDLASRYRLQH